MAKYLEVKNKIEEVKLKYSLNAIKDRKKMGITTVSEHKKILDRELEIVTGKTIKKLLSGPVEDYNKALREVERQNYKLDLMKEGVNYLIYKNQYLKPYLKSDGTVDKEKIDKTMDDSQIKNELYEVKHKLKKEIVSEISTNIQKNNEKKMIERNDLLEYFPYFKRIEHWPDNNIIFMEYDYIELESLDVSKARLLNSDYIYFKETSYSCEVKKIREIAEHYKISCETESDNKLELIDWIYNDEIKARNYSFAYNMTSIGSQYYINECIDNIPNIKLQEELKKVIFSSIFTTINPLGPNISASSLYGRHVKYTNMTKYPVSFPVRYVEEKGIQELINSGIPVDVYDIVEKRPVIVRKYNQD